MWTVDSHIPTIYGPHCDHRSEKETLAEKPYSKKLRARNVAIFEYKNTRIRTLLFA